jgi:hypothetical protein
METDTGDIIKVFVNATQADAFEKALADKLGKETDLEMVINDLANKFDVVDVEWPDRMKAGDSEVRPQDFDFTGGADETPAGPLQPNDEQPLNPSGEGDEGGSSVDLGLEPDFGGEGEEGGEGAGDGSEPEINTELEVGSDDGEGGGEEEESSDEGEAEGETEEEPEEEPEGETEEEPEEEEEEEGEPERDDFGQIISKKKKKKKKEEPEEEEEVEEAFMALAADLDKYLAEAPASQSFSNPAVQAIGDMLVGMGFDLNANRSYTYQAKRLIGQNTAGLMAAKQVSTMQKIKTARDALAKALQVSAGAANPATQQASNAPAQAQTQTQSYKLIGSIIAEKI